MSISELNKTKNLHNENTNSIPITQEQSYHVIDMELVTKETEAPRLLSTAKSKDFVCIDITANSIENRIDTNKEMTAGVLADISVLKVPVTSLAVTENSTMKEIQDCMVDFGKQQRLEQLPVTTHEDLNKSQDSLQAQGYAPSLGYPDVQKKSKESVARLRGGVDYNPGERSLFVVLVFAITFVMILSSAIFVGIVLMVPPLKDFFFEESSSLMLGALVLLLIVSYIFGYSSCSRGPPWSFMLLILTVISMSCITACASSKYKTELVFDALLATSIIMACCSLIALTGLDFTGFIIYIIVISLVFTFASLIFFGLRAVTGQPMEIAHLIMLLIGTLIQCVVLIMELQMILGGKAVEIDEDDYALGAFYLYTSILNLFLNLLEIFNLCSSE